jgi:hypothetical protein
MKSLQEWRLYEIGNDDNCKTFKNRFSLLSLRYTTRESGTLSTVRAALDLQDPPRIAGRTANHDLANGLFADEAIPTIEYEESERFHTVLGRPTFTKRKGNDDSTMTPRSRKRKHLEQAATLSRVRRSDVSGTRPNLLQRASSSAEPSQPMPRVNLPHIPMQNLNSQLLSITNPAQTVTTAPSPSQSQRLSIANSIQTLETAPKPSRSQCLGITNPVQIAETAPNLPKPERLIISNPVQLWEISPCLPKLQCLSMTNPARTVETAPVLPAGSHGSIQNAKLLYGGLGENAHNINIEWTLDVDGDLCDLGMSVADCGSFKGLLEKLQEMVHDLQSTTAAAQFKKITAWQMIYQVPGEPSKTRIAPKGSENAFNRMLEDLAQVSCWTQQTTVVKLRAKGAAKE